MSSGKEWLSLTRPLEALPQILDGSPDPSVSTISSRVSLDPNRQHVTNSHHTKYNAGNVSMTPHTNVAKHVQRREHTEDTRCV
jgi:hypothetical protein